MWAFELVVICSDVCDRSRWTVEWYKCTLPLTTLTLAPSSTARNWPRRTDIRHCCSWIRQQTAGRYTWRQWGHPTASRGRTAPMPTTLPPLLTLICPVCNYGPIYIYINLTKYISTFYSFNCWSPLSCLAKKKNNICQLYTYYLLYSIVQLNTFKK